ncbi:glycine N-acyltransferase-like protein 3 isoform X1 [Aedes aegypti]|uniref:GCN5-related N-acetyltransferase Rv2170-like domain-containing protein n=2 Tax=Aedes aegypti TaxID=7159 RepID=A0A903U7R5_AEDAE|nr:glycine N-acyltransferase-like protein 3 isoform X1 [Aedes aegypti]
MSNRLVEISSENWPELRDLFRSNWPEHVFAYGVVNNYWNWKQQPTKKNHYPTSEVQIFSLNGSWRENGTFLLFDHFEIYFYSCDSTSGYASLTEALLLVDWTKYTEVSMDFVEMHRIALDRVISAKRLAIVNDEVTNFYYMPKENASSLEVNLPESYHIDRISLDQLDYVYHQWPLKDSISATAGYNLLERLILLNDSVGLFDERDNLISWCLRDQTGAFSDLQTCQAHLRKGYARMVIMEFARRLAAKEDDSYAFVLRSNVKSSQLFESIGFQKITHLHWVVIRNAN